MFDPSKIMKDGCTICRREIPYEDEKPLVMAFIAGMGAYGLKYINICEYCDDILRIYFDGKNEITKTFHKDIPYQYPTKKDYIKAIEDDDPAECFRCHFKYVDISQKQKEDMIIDLSLDTEMKDSWRLISHNDRSFSMICPECNKIYESILKVFNEKFIEKHANIQE